VALVGREAVVLNLKMGFGFVAGFTALPTFFAGCVTLVILMGWVATLGIGWVALTMALQTQLQKHAKRAEGRMSVVATARLSSLTGVVHAIKAIKYFGWEPEFLRRLHATRAKECDALRSKTSWSVASVAIGKLTPVTASLITFVTYALLGNEIKAGDIFASNSVFMTMRFAVGASGLVIEMFTSMRLLVSRLEKLLLLPERRLHSALPEDAPALTSIADVDISFRRSPSASLCLEFGGSAPQARSRPFVELWVAARACSCRRCLEPLMALRESRARPVPLSPWAGARRSHSSSPAPCATIC